MPSNDIPSINRSKAGPRALQAFYQQRNALAALQVFQQEVGDIFQLSLPGFKPVVVAGPEAAHCVLVSEREQMSWRPEGDPVARLLRQGLLVVDGELHDTLRRQMLPALQKAQLPNYAEAMVSCTDQVTHGWGESGVFDMLDEMRRVALLIFMQTLFNVDFISDIDRLWPAILRLLTYISPGMWIFIPGKPRPGYSAEIRLVDEYLYRIIRQRRVGAGMAGDLLSLLVSTPGMDDGLVRDQLLTMLIAGHDTSTANLAWCLYLLGTHPQVYRQARDEVDGALATDPPAIADLERLPYLEQVTQEALRLYPPIHTGMRFTTSDVEMLGCTLPADSRLMYSIYLTQHMERHWPDPERFDPERFSLEGKRDRQPYTYLPFGGGPRNCIGSAFARVEVRLILARLLQTFDFTWEQSRVHPYMGATLEPRPGVPLRVQRRRRTPA